MCADKKGYEGSGCRSNKWWRQEAEERYLWETLVEAQEEWIRRKQEEGCMQWEPVYGRRRAVFQDAWLDTRNTRVGEVPRVIAMMGTKVTGEAG